MTKKAMIAMSGGVDSAAAALLCCNQGYDCCGATMQLQDLSSAGSCCTPQDIATAADVCHTLGIPHRVFDFHGDFKQAVINKFIAAYEAGNTPNPCVDCNRYLKFEKLMEKMEQLGYDYIVTGHYARVCCQNGRYLLKKGLDPKKDQSYVLYSLTQYQLSHILLPLGEYTKDQVRAMAADAGLKNAQKKESQDICFVPDGDYAGFIRRTTGKAYPPGNFVTADGRVLGQHKGMIHYTIGQRKGLGLALPAPMFVCQKRLEDNTIVLGYNSDLMHSGCLVQNFNWIAFDSPTTPLQCTVKTRYRQTEVPATATPLPDGSVQLNFDTPVRAVTCGQAAVLYQGDVVLGGGTIAKVLA